MNSTVARLKSSSIWQMAMVRPFPRGKDKWKTRFVSLLSYIFGFFVLIPLMSASLINDYMTSAIPLEQMHITSGILTAISECPRACVPTLSVRAKNSSSPIEFPIAKRDAQKLKSYIGTQLAVWSQTGFRIPTFRNANFFVENVYEIKIQKLANSCTNTSPDEDR
ncbi:MAG: hypothetical protein HZY77_12820 [Thiobacillus sp.]|uniref:hypothetical protein n=1 Tax=Thiobacillus sp. TaxID=924 RepID=UPI00168C7F32|nr:hypothetical protein [Thiobacillus sp.]QLQ03520.1 MAG: hypothetical protein HZY77_12820 [Thiobacillus sp.]